MDNNLFNQDFQDFIRALNEAHVKYMLLGGYSVILHGYERTTADMDIWEERTEKNYEALQSAFGLFGMRMFDMTREAYLTNPDIEVFTFGRKPAAIDVMLTVKGLDFEAAYANASEMDVDGLKVNVIHYKDLMKAKTAAARNKDLNDIEHLKLHKGE